MPTTKLLIAAAALSAFAMGASAETYQGVLQFQSNASRSAVQAGAVVAAHSADAYAEGASAGAPTVVAGLGDRAQARADAIAAARAGNIYADGAGAGPDERFASTLDRATVRAHAVAAAHGVDRLAL
ncbi:helicase SNF2 [Variovorax sp. J22G73]|uniref:helicase SNF2 n=1 Tax=unclassified Variovorax TaxID=663243 RepID=UPI000D5DA4A2|nr:MULTISPECIES: helicase SNF2 [unclassified Variovorax]MDM0008507.1 helicase SNF2 [Variovorax sp. J22R203]MDM0101014.1 helicase SNF2 [Variovorax sp. J22G73]